MRPQLVRRTLQDNVYEYLREALMGGQFTPGERLTVRGVAAATGTSIMPVREAFRRLTSEGALEPLATGAIRVPTFDLLKLQDLTQIRLTVEGLAARLAAQRISGEEFRALEHCDQEVQWALDRRDVAAEIRANEHFHFCVYRAAQSAELLRIIEHLWLQIGPYLAWLLKQARRPARYRGRHAFRYHKDIMEALRRRDGQRAEAALRADLTTAADILMQQARNLPPASR
jgi:DNA-binding GntR family transcriptional regulator